MQKRSIPKPRSTPMAARSRPKLGWCQECRAPIWGATYDALPIKLDPYALSPRGELIAHILGLRTVLVMADTIWIRNAFAIQTSPTGLGGFIVRDHRCGLPIPFGEQLKELKTYSNDEPDF